MSWDLVLEIAGFLIGIIYLWYEYHASAKVWLVSVIMPMISMWIYFRKGLYADFGINIYYVVIAVYGYLHWTLSSRRRRLRPASAETVVEAADASSAVSSVEDDAEAVDVSSVENDAERSGGAKSLPITHVNGIVMTGCGVAAFLLWVAIYLILRYFTDSTVPVADAFTTALSIVGLWMMARKYVEQWLVWMVVDAVCVGLYIYKGIYFYAALYAVYTVVAWFGYRKWYKMAL